MTAPGHTWVSPVRRGRAPDSASVAVPRPIKSMRVSSE